MTNVWIWLFVFLVGILERRGETELRVEEDEEEAGRRQDCDIPCVRRKPLHVFWSFVSMALTTSKS